MAKNSLQEDVDDINNQKFKYLANLETEAEMKVRIYTNHKILVFSLIILAIVAAVWLIVYYGFFHQNYDQCINDCEISSIKTFKDIDCKKNCEKYK